MSSANEAPANEAPANEEPRTIDSRFESIIRVFPDNMSEESKHAVYVQLVNNSSKQEIIDHLTNKFPPPTLQNILVEILSSMKEEDISKAWSFLAPFAPHKFLATAALKIESTAKPPTKRTWADIHMSEEHSENEFPFPPMDSNVKRKVTQQNDPIKLPNGRIYTKPSKECLMVKDYPASVKSNKGARVTDWMWFFDIALMPNLNYLCDSDDGLPISWRVFTESGYYVKTISSTSYEVYDGLYWVQPSSNKYFIHRHKVGKKGQWLHQVKKGGQWVNVSYKEFHRMAWENRPPL